jgi:hypothetical protein
MPALFEGRSKLVIAVIAVIVAIVAFQKSGGASTPTVQGEKVADAVLQQRAQAQDTAAQALLQSAAVAMESWFVTNASFAGSETGVAALEPNIGWVPAGAVAAQNQVAVSVGADQASYTLTTTSTSGITLTYVRDPQAQVARSCGPGCTW